MGKLKKFFSYFALIISTLLIFANCDISVFAMKNSTNDLNGTSSFKQVIQFEDQKHFSSDNGNAVRNDQFKGYSGNGYVYLASGWTDVNFTVPSDGKYKITIVTNSDQYKENWLYLDSNSAGKLCTNANTWNQTTNEYTLTKGQHKFGVSSNWGYVAIDYMVVESVDDPTPIPTPTPGPIVTKGGMYVNGTNLYDGNGNPFLFRGVSLAHAWFPSYTQTSINAVAKLGANSVRVVLADGFQWTKTSSDEVKNIISWCRQNNLVCILEVHDHTGHDDPNELDNTAADYWIGLKDILNANKDYVVVNIANEWLGTWGKGDVWTNAYCTAIKKLRDAGIQNVFMVDAPGYGQETSSLISNCTTVKNADITGNTMFSIHMYSVAGKDAATVKSNIDNMLGKGVCTIIGEFGDYQNGGVVDASTIMSYSAQKQVGTMAWSWKGNGGQDANLDLSNDWAGTNLTDWGEFVFSSDYGIQKTSKLAYTGSGYTGPVVNPPIPPTPPIPTPTPTPMPAPTDDEAIKNIKPGYLNSLTTPWYVSSKGDDTTSTVSSIKKLSNGGYRLSFDLATDPYPYLVNMAKGLDFSKNSKVNVVVRNNNAYAVQLQPIFKVGDGWTWTEYDKYQEIPALTTEKLTFDMSTCAGRNEVNAILFRIQGAGSKFAGSVDFLSVDTDLATDAYSTDIAELNRPKSASYFTWSYPEASFKDQTTSTSCTNDGNIGIEFKNVTSTNAAGVQTETKPGLGKGLDCSPYKTVTCTITNNSSVDISMSLLLRTTSNWTWQENCGTIDGKAGAGLIPAGKSVNVTYSLNDSTWKSALSNWDYTGKLQAKEDVRAIAFKIWSNSDAGASGKVKISNFAFNF